MRGVSALLTIAAAIAVDCAGAAYAANQPATGRLTRGEARGEARGELEQLTAPSRALAPLTIAFTVDLAEAPLLPSGRSRPSQPSQSTGPDRDLFQYRLIVQGSSDSLLRRVRQVVPDAFRATVNGRRVIQTGLFVTREEAEAVEQQLSRLDLDTQILELDAAVDNLARSGTSRTRPRSQSSRSGTENFQYRLVVQGSSDSLLRQVRQIVPDAFRTTIAGRRVVQAGLFVTREEAEAMQRQLAQLDAVSSIFDVSYGIAQRPQSLAQDGRTVIVIDPGHGGGDPGAVGIGGIQEADIVLDIAQQVADLLENQGIRAVMTRSDDREVELEPRVDLADSVRADLFVSIHANAIDLSRPDVNGIETYYYDSGAALASSIHNSLVGATGMADRGVRQARFYVLTRTSMPAVLVEVGFVTGREDAARFQSAQARTQIATAIAQGILRYVQ